MIASAYSYLKPGDTMRPGVDGLGVQEQRVRAWDGAH